MSCIQQGTNTPLRSNGIGIHIRKGDDAAERREMRAASLYRSLGAEANKTTASERRPFPSIPPEFNPELGAI